MSPLLRSLFILLTTCCILSVDASRLVNQVCDDTACAQNCTTHQDLQTGVCFQVASAAWSTIDPCNPTDTSAYFTIYMDAACTEALNTQQVPLNQPSCTGGAGKSWFISCVADGKTPASVSKRKSHTLHQKLKINQEVKAAPTSHYAQATGPRHSHMKPHSLARPHRHTNSTSGYPPLPLERHTVFFHYTSTTTPDDRLAIDTLYRSIPQKSTYVVSIEGNAPNNPPNSQEGFQQNIDEAYITTFLNTQDRDFFVGRPFTYPFGRYSPHSSSNSACRCRCTRVAAAESIRSHFPCCVFFSLFSRSLCLLPVFSLSIL